LAPGGPCLPGGDESFVVGLLDRGEVVRGLLHAGKQALRDLVALAVCVQLQGRFVCSGVRGFKPCSQHSAGVEVENHHQHLKEGERRETLTALEAADVLAGNGLA